MKKKSRKTMKTGKLTLPKPSAKKSRAKRGSKSAASPREMPMLPALNVKKITIMDAAMNFARMLTMIERAFIMSAIEYVNAEGTPK